MTFYGIPQPPAAVHQLVNGVLHGSVRLAAFQRGRPWTTERRGLLLDSIYRGFPIGQLVQWTTECDVDTLHVVGGVRIPDRNPDRPTTVLIDGRRRLDALVGILGGDSAWEFDPNASVGERFRPRETVSRSRVPLGLMMDRAALNRWIMESDLDDRGIRIVDALRDRLREYSVPVVELACDTLSDAIEFSRRVNSSAG